MAAQDTDHWLALLDSRYSQ